MVRGSVVHLVLFVAVVGVSTLTVGSMLAETSLYAGSVADEGDRRAAAIDAEVAIVNDPAAGTTYDAENGTVTLYVKNVGGSTLDPGALEALLDGEYVEPSSTRVFGADRWREGRLLEVVVDRRLATGDHRALVEIDGATDHLAYAHRTVSWLDPSDERGTFDCDDGSCSVDANETDRLNLTAGTDPVLTNHRVDYGVDDTAVVAVAHESGATDGAGENETTLTLEGNGTTEVVVDAGWDRDAIEIAVVNASDGG